MADIRHIEEKDQLQLANIIRSVFEEYGAPLVNTVYDDPRTEHVFNSLAGKNAGYWVAADNGIVLGGCGFRHIPQRLGDSGHTATTIFMVKDLIKKL